MAVHKVRRTPLSTAIGSLAAGNAGANCRHRVSWMLLTRLSGSESAALLNAALYISAEDHPFACLVPNQMHRLGSVPFSGGQQPFVAKTTALFRTASQAEQQARAPRLQ